MTTMGDSLVTFFANQWDISRRIYGDRRSEFAPIGELRVALGRVERDPLNVFELAELFVSAVEVCLRANTTPFAIAQAIVNRQNEMAAQKTKAPLAKFVGEPQKVDRSAAPTREETDKMRDETLAKQAELAARELVPSMREAASKAKQEILDANVLNQKIAEPKIEQSPE